MDGLSGEEVYKWAPHKGFSTMMKREKKTGRRSYKRLQPSMGESVGCVYRWERLINAISDTFNTVLTMT